MGPSKKVPGMRARGAQGVLSGKGAHADMRGRGRVGTHTVKLYPSTTRAVSL